MKKILFRLFLSVFLVASANAAAKTKVDIRPDGLYLTDVTVAQLEKQYELYGYKDYIYMPDWVYPPIFLTNLPTDFDRISDANRRNKLFLQIIGPLALKLSDELREERLAVRELRAAFLEGADLTPEQERFVEEKAVKYDVFTRMKGRRRYDILLKRLELKVNIVPPSLLMAAAAIESDWGTNRIVREGNSLYKELAWYTDKGLKPQDDRQDQSYRYKTFPSLYDSMKSYALRLNSSVNYEQMRLYRAEIEYREKPVFGRSLAHTMLFDSNLKNFAGLLDYTITFYELTNFDEAELGFVRLPDLEDKK